MMPGRHVQGRATAGFTLIELLIVIGVMLMLSTLAITGIARTLRVAAINTAVGSVRTTAAMASLRAMHTVAASGVEYPGVLLAKLGNSWAVAAISADAADAHSVDFNDALLDEEGLPAITKFSPNVVVWAGDSPAAASDSFVWFYEPGTGQVVAPHSSGTGFSAPGAMVGTEPPPLFSGTTLLVFGAQSDSLTIVAPPTADNPGLSFRSRDQRTKRAISVQPSGSIDVREFD